MRLQHVIHVMKRISLTLIYILCIGLSWAHAQERRVQNRPYTDLRPFHFGVIVGTHAQDIDFRNVGPHLVETEEGGMVEKTIVTDQDRWDVGFTVGVLGEFRLSEFFQFRIAPALHFGTRHLTLRNLTDLTPEGLPIEQHQEMKTAYMSSAFDLIFAAPRFNNHRPYIMAGINPLVNLSAKSDDYIKLKPFDLCVEVGVGCDFYLPFFKLRPELKFMYGLTNSIDSKHADQLKDRNMRMYTQSVDKATTKMVVLSFYFE